MNIIITTIQTEFLARRLPRLDPITTLTFLTHPRRLFSSPEQFIGIGFSTFIRAVSDVWFAVTPSLHRRTTLSRLPGGTASLTDMDRLPTQV